MTGLRLAHYRITSELGRGGMGIVYRAEDENLDRTVALKVLPPHALASEDDRARFYREARAAAKLSHAHICHVYQVDEAVLVEAGSSPAPDAEKRPFIAMEFVDGESLADRIAKGPLKLEEAVRLATQIAEALGVAHEAGVVHRDIKPGNVMLTAKGESKVLDFGLAKTAASTQLTRQGSTLGTVAYMSPEQARGEDVDRRTDLWALGVVLYEMVAGRLPFAADYEQAALYGILNENPEPLTAIRTGVPMELEAIVGKLLRKEARLRYQSAADVLADLNALSVTSTTSQRSMAAMPAASASAPSEGTGDAVAGRWRLYALWFGVAGLLAGALVTAWLIRREAAPRIGTAEVVRSTIQLPAEYALQLTYGQTLGLEMDAIDLTHDGAYMVYVAGRGRGEVSILVLRDMRNGTFRALEGTEEGYNPVFSPDGRSIAYLTPTGIYRVPTEGGRPEFVTQMSDATGIGWSRDGWIYLADLQGSDLVRVRPTGEREDIAKEGRCNCGLPTNGREGDLVVVTGRDREVAVAFRADGTLDTLAIRGNHVTFLPGGQVVYTRTGRLMASLWNPATGVVQPDSRVLLDDLRTGSIVRSGHYGVSDAGTLVYVSGEPSGLVELVIREADGSEIELPMPLGVYGPLAVSPDETRLLVTDYDRGAQTILVDLERGNQQVVIPEASTGSLLWSPDGRRLTYTRVLGGDEAELWQADPNRPSDAERLVRGAGYLRASAWSPDGAFLAYERGLGPARDIVIRRMADSTEFPIRSAEGETLWAADLSRDGRHVAYTRVARGGSSVLVDTVPPSGNPVIIASSGAEEPEWLPDRDALVYRSGDEWRVVELLDATGLSFTEPRILFQGPYVNIAGIEYRMMSGRRAVLQRPRNTTATVDHVEVITGFDRLIEQAFN